MLQGTHNLKEWAALWESTSTPESARFLASFPQPLYVSTLGNLADLISAPPPCLKKITPILYISECE